MASPPPLELGSRAGYRRYPGSSATAIGLARQSDCGIVVSVIKSSIDTSGKGWLVGPWNSDLPIAIGFSDRGFDDPHCHDAMCELYLVARGTSTALVDGQVVVLSVGDLLVVERGEAHTFTSSSDDYLHFVVQAPFVPGDKRSI